MKLGVFLAEVDGIERVEDDVVAFGGDQSATGVLLIDLPEEQLGVSLVQIGEVSVDLEVLALGLHFAVSEQVGAPGLFEHADVPYRLRQQFQGS
jgi:hypothetical protein